MSTRESKLILRLGEISGFEMLKKKERILEKLKSGLILTATITHPQKRMTMKV